MISHLRILIVDDDATIRDMLGVYLESKGYAVAKHVCAEDALTAVRTDSFDIVVCDVKMPGMSGLDFVRCVHRMRPQLCAIIMTAFGKRYSHTLAMRAGANGFLVKPFSLTQFNHVLERAYWNALSSLDNEGAVPFASGRPALGRS